MSAEILLSVFRESRHELFARKKDAVVILQHPFFFAFIPEVNLS